MDTVTQVARAMQKVLSEEADKLARETGFVQRRSEMGGAEFAQALVLGWLANPQATLEELSQAAIAAGACITPQALDKRFTPQAAKLMERLLAKSIEQVLASKPKAIPVLERFKGVYLIDSSTITLPDDLADVWAGCGGSRPEGTSAAVKLQVRVDYASGRMEGPMLQDGRSHDQNTPLLDMPLPAGALHLADLGYANLTRLEAYEQQGVMWLVRLKVNTQLYVDGMSTSLVTLLGAQSGHQIDIPVEVGAKQRLACRLLAVRVPPDVAQKRRRRLHARAKRKGKMVSQDRLTLADWDYYITNAPPDLLSLEDALVLVGVRWQIELLFKLWKSQGKLDSSRSRKLWRILCEFYAKLLTLVVQHWIFLATCWSYYDISLHKAAQTIRKHAFVFAHALSDISSLSSSILAIARCLSKGCRLARRAKQPATFQRLLSLYGDS